MSDYDIIMQAAGPTLDAYFPQREPDGPLPEADDQPRDMAELEHEALEALYVLYFDSLSYYEPYAVSERDRSEYDKVSKRAEIVATAMGRKDEWLKMIEDKK